MKEIVPKHNKGTQSNTESSIELKNEQEAKEYYELVKERLLDVNKWNSYAGTATAHFYLTDEKGNEVDRQPRKGDYFKIDVPAPGSESGEGYDWVQVEEISERNNDDEDVFGIRVRPASSPVNDKKDVAHFFTDEATSSFIVKRSGNKVIAAVYGRNEMPNMDAEKITDKIRNATVATGAMTAFSKLQWKSLVNGLLKK